MEIRLSGSVVLPREWQQPAVYWVFIYILKPGLLEKAIMLETIRPAETHVREGVSLERQDEKENIYEKQTVLLGWKDSTKDSGTCFACRAPVFSPWHLRISTAQAPLVYPKVKRKRPSYLPAAEILEEKVQGRGPYHCCGNDAEEWDWENLLWAAKLQVRSRGCLDAHVRYFVQGPRLLAPHPLPSWWCKRPGRAAGYRWRCPAYRKQSPWADTLVQKRHCGQEEELFCSLEGRLVTDWHFYFPHPLKKSENLKTIYKFY